MEVIKFGGSSLVDASAMTQVADVLEARKEVPKFVVLSAMGGATDALLQAGRSARDGNPAWHTIVSDLRARHLTAASVLLEGAAEDACLLYTSPSPRDATLSRMPSSA